MLKHRLTVFCESALAMADGRMVLAGVFPGRALFPAPGPGAFGVIDINLQFGSDAIETVNVELRITNSDGAVVAQFKQQMEFREKDAVFTCTVNKLVIPAAGPGYLRVHYRTDDANWMQCGDLLLQVNVPATAVQVQ